MKPAFVTEPSVFIFYSVMGKNRREPRKLLEAKISPRLARLYFQRQNWHRIKEASIQCASKTSSMTAISEAQGALVTAVGENRRQRRRQNDRLILLLSQEVETHGHHPRRKYRIK